MENLHHLFLNFIYSFNLKETDIQRQKDFQFSGLFPKAYKSQAGPGHIQAPRTQSGFPLWVARIE